MTDDNHLNIEKETIVVTTEDGVVMTGSKAEALEARIMASVRKPLFMICGVLGVIFVLMLGVSVIISDLAGAVHDLETTVAAVQTTANNTDRVINEATSPEAQARQAQRLQDILGEVNCQDQRNLQNLVTQLVAAGFSQLTAVSIVESQCVKE